MAKKEVLMLYPYNEVEVRMFAHQTHEWLDKVKKELGDE